MEERNLSTMGKVPYKAKWRYGPIALKLIHAGAQLTLPIINNTELSSLTNRLIYDLLRTFMNK